MTPEVTVYGNQSCPYCGAARMLLTKKGVTFRDVLVGEDQALLDEMTRKSGSRSVPQIFIDETHVGGFDALVALDDSGELDILLAGNQQTDRA